MTMTREQVQALVGRLVGPSYWKRGPTTDDTSEAFDCAPSDAALALMFALDALDDLDAVKAELERDRSQVIDTVNALHSEIAGRQWMLEGRGPYEWDDDRYRDEFAAALEVIKAPIEVLRKIGGDWSNCPTDPAAIKAARVNDRARATAAEAANAALTARNEALREGITGALSKMSPSQSSVLAMAILNAAIVADLAAKG